MNTKEMTPKERIHTALRRQTPDRIPAFEWFIDPSVGKALTGSDDLVEVIDQLDIDGINIRADYSREFVDGNSFIDEWGAKRMLTGDCIAAVHDAPIKDIATHMDYRFPDPQAPHRFSMLEKALNRFGDRRAIILNLRDGWSDMRDLLGYEEALIMFMIEPDRFKELLDRVVDYNLELASIAKDRYNTTIVATTDDVANNTGLLFPPEKYFDLIGPAFKKIIQGYKDLGYLTIKHCDGKISDVLDFWVECGIDCLDPIDPGAGMTLKETKKLYGNRICIKGNVDCTGALCNGTEEETVEEVKACIQQAGLSGYILSSSNTIHRGVKPENYRAMLEALRDYGTS